jgi:hypothetical protein
MIVVADRPAIARKNPRDTVGAELSKDEGMPTFELELSLSSNRNAP